jgi:beta-lactamase regulating signal transducer with metallopeptidase domain
MIATWFLIGLVLMCVLARRQYRVLRLLAGRRAATDGEVRGMLTELRRQAGVSFPVRLSVSNICPTPVALGWSEICIPERFLTDLDSEQQRSALAHELAHLIRRDPTWEIFAAVVNTMLFFQPLNLLARRRIRDAAENLCDDWAVRWSDSPLSLARCLADVGSWIGAGPETLSGTVALGERRSSLLLRVKRLADHRQTRIVPPLYRIAGAAVLLVGTVSIAPAVSIQPPVQAGLSRQPGRAPQTIAARIQSVAQRLAMGTVRGGSDTIIVFSGPATPLPERWSWAIDSAPTGRLAIGWGVTGGVTGSGTLSSNAWSSESERVSWNAEASSPSLQQVLQSSAGSLPRTAFVFDFADSRRDDADIVGIRLRSPTAPIALSGRTFVWLGVASTEESLAMLRRLYAAFEDPELRSEIAAALTLHADREQVLQAVGDLMRDEASPVVRSEAVEWLPRTQAAGGDIVRLLQQTVSSDPSMDVRREAVTSLGNLDSQEALQLLRALGASSPERELRLEAVDALAAHGGVELLDLGRTSTYMDVRKEVVEQLARKRTSGLVAILVQFQTNDPAREVRREAVDQLARLAEDGSAEARDALVRAMQSDSDPAIRSEAAEALSDMDR